MILTRIAEHCAARIPKSTSSVGGWYRLGPNDQRPHRVAQPFLASASASASQEREFGEDVRKRERSRARRTSTPACGILAAPSSVSAGRRRPKVAVADGQENTRGRQTLDGQTERNNRSYERERAGGQHRQRSTDQGWRGSAVGKAIRQCRTLFPWNRTESRAEHRESRRHWAARRREGESGTRRAFSCSVRAPRSVRALFVSAWPRYLPVSDPCVR